MANPEQASWQTVIIAAIVLSGMVLIVIAYFERKTHGDWRRRRIDRDSSGQITRIGEVSIPEPIHISGVGTYTANKISLERGRYKVSYRFPESVLTAVKIMDAETGDETVMFAKSGTGEVEITLNASRRYLVEVDPIDGATHTEMTISPLGLPSRRHADESEPMPPELLE